MGINPGERSAQLGHYYGHRGNAFWQALSASALVDGDVGPTDDRLLLDGCGIGFTDVVKRVMTDSTRISDAELRASASAFERRIAYAAPRAVCFTTTRAFDVLFPRVRASGHMGPTTGRYRRGRGVGDAFDFGARGRLPRGRRRVLAELACALGRRARR